METKLHYYAAWTERGFLLGCDHEHQTLTDALDCNAVQRAGSYVIAVENGVERALNHEEEAEYQRAPRKRPTPAVLHEASGYAVMVRVKFADGWGWDTWMRYETHEQALAHARPYNKVVPFGSAEWHVLRQSREPALPAPSISPLSTQSPRREYETLIEYVSRCIPAPLDPLKDETNVKDLDTAIPVASESPRPTFTDVVLQWLNNWQVKALDRTFSLLVAATALVSALRSKMRRRGRRK